MFTPYEDQINSDAAVVAGGNEPDVSSSPNYSGSTTFSNITKYPTGRVGNPMGTSYQRFLPIFARSSAPKHFTQSMPGISSLSSSMAASASPIADRMAAREPQETLQTHDIPASFNPARISTRVTHRDLPLSRGRVEEMFSRQNSRGFAF